MITNDDSAILQEASEEWTKEMVRYVEKHKDNMTARNILETRTIGADVEIDIITNYDRTGPGAQIVAKGTPPDKAGTKTYTDQFNIYQIATGFNVNAKDLKKDPKIKNRQIDICMRDIHRAEDRFALFGDSKLGVMGIIDAAQANENGTITSSTNAGAWTGETGTDIYDDLNVALGKMDAEFEPAYLLGSRTALQNLNRMNSERIPYYKEVAGLFGKKNENDKSWMWTTDQLNDINKVYLIPKDMMAGEYVISENPRIVNYNMQPGENYPIEIVSWSAPEIHDPNAFVEIDIS